MYCKFIVSIKVMNMVVKSIIDYGLLVYVFLYSFRLWVI